MNSIFTDCSLDYACDVMVGCQSRAYLITLGRSQDSIEKTTNVLPAIIAEAAVCTTHRKLAYELSTWYLGQAEARLS
jgi:hypothetical protein